MNGSIPPRGHVGPASGFAELRVNAYTLRDNVVVALPSEVYDRSIGAMQECVLSEIERRAARGLVIDLTSVDLVDRFLVQAVLDLAQMASLLGARAVVTGVHPEVAAVLSTLGFDSGDTTFAGSVEDALAQLDHERRSNNIR